MSVAQLPGSVRDLVLVEGQVVPERARRLYHDATAVFEQAIRNLEPLAVSESSVVARQETKVQLR